MSVSSTVEYPPCHRAKSSPQQWDADFESLFRGRLALTTAQGYFESFLLEERHELNPNHHDERLQEYAYLKQQLCGLQRNVSAQAANFLFHEDLATKWLDSSVEVRAKHALIGVAGACAISPNLNKARLACSKELRVKYLSDDGQVLLDLLKVIAPADLLEIPTEPQYVPNADWDRVVAAHHDTQDEVEKVTLSYILVLRNKLIAHVLQFIIHSFLGHELPKITVYKRAHKRVKAPPNPITEMYKEVQKFKYGKAGYEAIEAEFMAAYKERTANKVNCCHGCGKQGGKRETYKRCAACWKINREILYCSRECQVANWKVEHKHMCGKPLNFDTASMIATLVPKPSKVSQFPPPDPGFKRSVELLKQIELLDQHPDFEYAVKRSIFENNESIGMLRYDNPDVKRRFRLHRESAMTKGNIFSVAVMLEYVLWDIDLRKATDFRTQVVIQQFSREYGIPLAELKEELEELNRLRDKRHFPVLTYFDV